MLAGLPILIACQLLRTVTGRHLQPGPQEFILHFCRSAVRRLCERQTKSGGLNGRPEKLQDVCYSWWCLSALSILRRLHWISHEALVNFILDCQVVQAALPVPRLSVPGACQRLAWGAVPS